MAGGHVAFLLHIDGDGAAGIDRLAANDTRMVLLHQAAVREPTLRGVTSTFAPWNRMSSPASV